LLNKKRDMKKVTLTKNEIQNYLTYKGVPKFNTSQEEYEWADSQTKKCNKCHEHLPLTCFGFSTSGRFPFNKEGLRYRRGECLDCGLKISNGKRKAKQIAEKSGISIKPSEGVKCELCPCKENLVFDHSHKTETFRGWLCDPCNRSLGTLESRLGSNWLNIITEYVNK
jgi:hypothetical protein